MFTQALRQVLRTQIPFTCIQFPLYEYMKATLAVQWQGLDSVNDLPASQAAVCGSIAGGFAAAVTTPLDVAKTRIMLSVRNVRVFGHVGFPGERHGPLTAVCTIQGASGVAPYSSNFITTISRIAREEGFKTLFRGIVPRVTWISIGGAIFLGVYERAKQTLMRTAVLS